MDTSVLHIHHGVRWRWLGFDELWAHRGLLLSLGVRDVKLRYKQTLLGVAWVVLQPLLSAGIMTAVFGLIAGAPNPSGVPYFVFVYLGQMAWTLFSITIARTGGAMVGNIALVTKIYFPRAILPLSTILGVLLDFAMSLALAIPMLIVYGTVGMNLPVVALTAALLVLCATGMGMVLATVSVRFRDVLYVLPLIVQLGLYASPVAYGLAVARDNLNARGANYFTVYMLNPLASLIETFRWGLLGEGLFLPWHFVYGALFSVGIFILGCATFRASEGKFADVI